MNNPEKTTIEASPLQEIQHLPVSQGYDDVPDSIYQEMLFIEGMDQGDTESVGRALDYTMNSDKTIELVTGVNCTPETAYAEMVCIKTMFNKLDKRQFVHFVQSFHPEEQTTPQQVHEIGVRLVKEFERFSGFQAVVATHTNEEHLHNHFVINSVNMENGSKWQQSKWQLQQLKDFSDQLCRKYGLSTIEHKEPRQESTGEYRARQKGQSWKHELRLSVEACMKNSVSREDFVSNMHKLGYGTKWTDTRKDITFFTTEGKKCRIDNLDKALTKEVLEETFKFNREFKNLGDMAGEIKKLELAIQIAKAGAETQKAEQQADEKHGTETKESKKSWEDKLRQAIDTCIENSVGRDDFVTNMRKLGYEVNWTNTRKDITFITPEGRKRRNSTLDESLTKEALTKAFKFNREFKDTEVMAAETKKMKSLIRHQEEIDSADLGQEEQLIEGSRHEFEPTDVRDQDHDESPNQERSQDGDFGAMKFYVKWNDRYNEARDYLYSKDSKDGEEEVEQDFNKAYQLFSEEALAGNALAMHDLGRMNADGLGVDMDTELSQKWYSKAFAAFMAVEKEEPKPYIQYRLGKMLAAGLGATQNYEEAADWFKMAAAENHKYAQYSLAGLYYRGQGVEQSFTTAFSLYQKSAAQKNVYASYEVAKMFRNGVGTEIDIVEAEKNFKNAFIGFSALEADSHDDKLQYRLGQMLYTGTGTEKDVTKAVDYLELSAKLGNVNAQYLLAKIYLEADSAPKNVERALEWLGEAAENGNVQAQYALGKLYRDGNHVEKDIVKAVELFKSSAEQENQFAQYALGKLYLADEGIPKDGVVAIKWLTLSSDLGNQFAQYSLAKLYLAGEETPKDIELAIKLLTESANQQNQFAQYALGKLYLFGEEIPKDVEAAVKWLRASAEQENNFAQYTLGKLYIEGKEVPKDVEAGIKLFTASAEQGNPYASFELGKIYRDGLGINKDIAEAEKYFKNAFIGFSELEADSHNDKLQYRLGQMLYTGTGTEKDVVKAVDYLELSVKLGNVNAQYLLAKIYLEADSALKNVERALEWLGKAAENGNAQAQYALGKLYRDGNHVEKDIVKAVELFKLSAEQENQFAQYALGKLYLSGEDIPKDVETAVKWLRASVDQANSFAQYTLGKLYVEGEDVLKDVKVGLNLLTASAEQGNQFAQFQLGKIYLAGKEVEQDKDLATHWLSLSATQGNEYAQLLLEKMDSYNATEMEFLFELMQFFSTQDHNKNRSRNYPLSRLEGHALREKILELQFGSGMIWDKGQGYER